MGGEAALVTRKVECLGEVLEFGVEPAALKVPTGQTLHLDADVTKRAEKAAKKLSQFLHTLANEPTLGLYHVQEHIKRAAPKCVEIKTELLSTASQLETVSMDTGDTLAALEGLRRHTSLKSALQHAQHALAAVEGRRASAGTQGIALARSQPHIALPVAPSRQAALNAPARAGTAPDARLTTF